MPRVHVKRTNRNKLTEKRKTHLLTHGCMPGYTWCGARIVRPLRINLPTAETPEDVTCLACHRYWASR